MGRLVPGAHLTPSVFLVERIGAGGLGEVWLARDEGRGPVVVKVAALERRTLLEREALVAGRLDHPAIVRVHGGSHDDERAWLVVEHVPGGDARRLRGAAPEHVVRAVLPLVDALEHAHGRGVVHRDVKPSNVLLDREGCGRLGDFGLAGVLAGGPSAAPLAGGGSEGSLSPQQLDGEAPHPADDVYGLGALLYDLLSGQPPFWPDFDPTRVRTESPRPLETRIPAALRELVFGMLAKRREERPSLVAVRQALLASLAPPTGRARPDVVLQPPPRVEALVAPGAPPAAGAAAGAARSRPARASAAPAVALFAGLGLAALAVFVLLPRWVASRPRPAVVAASAPAPPTVAPAPASPPETREPDPPTDATAEPRLTPAPPAREDRRAAPEPPPPAADPAEDRWSAAISEGLAALDRGEFASAKAAFASAEAARPGTPSVADGLARAEEGLKTQALASHRAAALVAEAREDWRTAVGEYDAALRIDPQVAFAVSGRERSGARAELDARLQGYLQRPDRLSAEAVAREAEEALDRAREASPAGPRLAQQIASLEVRLKEAHTPVDVRLESDGLTEVSVLRVGSLGTFREKSIPLKPGSYVVVGKRPGYRDARRTLVVAPGKSPEPLRVRCDEVL